MDHSIGVMLTSFKRPHTLRQQLAAIDSQTVKPKDVVIWHNDGGVQPDVEAMRGRKVVALNYNSGVWARFSAALWLLPYEFIVVLDDDTIPGPLWLSCCMSAWERRPSLIGVNGVTFMLGDRKQRSYHGLGEGDSEDRRVDIVGHGFFVANKILRKAADLPRFHESTAGEDYHLAYAAQECELPTYALGSGRLSQRGSLNPSLGTDDAALYRQSGEEEKKSAAHNFYRTQGWLTLYEINYAHSPA